MAAGGGGGSGTCQRTLPAQARRKNEATPAYTIAGIPKPCPPSRPNACPSSPPRQGFKEKAKAAAHQKVGELKERAEKKLHQKISSFISGNK